ncbi:MAG: outer membrane lipoprotein-sorting protein [Alphaproteobacteria bacterium]|nr:outer membrane lipoprotein-sorting protein [Alphaproteobacteria bacterium]
MPVGRLAYPRLATLGLAILLPAVAAFAGDIPTGPEIMDAVAARHDRPFEATVGEMTLTDAGGRETRRLIRGFARREADGGSRHMLTFVGPPAIAGVAMLAWDHPGGRTDQWLFLPAAGEPTRVLGGARRGFFLDTDFALEDFLVDRRERHRQDRVADADDRGVPCYVVEIRPSDPEVAAASGYRLKRVFVGRADHLVRRVEYFDRDTGRHVKTMLLLEVAEPSPGTLRPRAYRMENHRDRHASAITITGWDFTEAAVPLEMFAPRWLAARRHMR